MDDVTISTIEIIMLVIGSSGIGGLIIAIMNAAMFAKKSTVEDLFKLYEIEKTKRQELEEKVNGLEEELQMRDELIVDLKDWIERLLKQFAEHIPHVTPAEFIRRQAMKVK